MSEARTLIAQLTSLSEKPDFETNPACLASTLHLAKQLQVATQRSEDAAIELCFHPIFAAAARIAIDLRIFHIIAEQSSGIGAPTLADKTGCAENLLVRLLRPLSALNFVQELSENVWIPTEITKAMCLPPIEAAHVHFWDQGSTAAMKMPQYFKENGYRQPEDPRNGLFQYSMGTKQEAFELWFTQPAVIDNFNTCMTGIRGSRPSWIEWYPVEERLLAHDYSNDPQRVLLVDVAGGRGHDIQAFGRKFGSYKGRLVLQDLPAVIRDIKKLDERIDKVEYDFFMPQPIDGARIYFFHFIMHDWSDSICVEILSRTAATMKRGYSKLLLNEFILPNRNCPSFPIGFDLQMMVMHAAQERTETQWRKLLEMAGLKLVKFWIPPGGGEGIIEAEIE